MADARSDSAPDRHDGEESATSPAVNLASGCTLALTGLGALVWLIPNHIDAAAGSYDVSPAFMPRLAATVIMLLGAALAVTAGIRLRSVRPAADWQSLILPGAWAIACVAIYLGVTRVGFVYAMPLVVGAGLLMSGQRSWLIILPVAILFPLAIDIAAWQLFTVELP